MASAQSGRPANGLSEVQKPVLEQTASKKAPAKQNENAAMNFIENESIQKLRGGYYTPLDLATFLVRWVAEIDPQFALEPSCGDGIFFRAISAVRGLSTTTVTAFELDPLEAEAAQRRARELEIRASVAWQDFLGWALKHINDREVRFDAVVGNPPFIRYQYLPTEFQARAEKIFEVLHLPFTKHTNAWVPFVLASVSLLRPGGRIAMVVPAEIIHVMHAQALRSYLGRECRRVVLIDPKELWFDQTLQGAVLLLAEKRRSRAEKSEGFGIYEVNGREFLRRNPDEIFAAPRCLNGKTVDGKWTRALLGRTTLDLLDKLMGHTEIHEFDDIAKVDVGIVTGANKYFLVPDEVVEKFRLSEWAYPMFGRSEHCPGIIYDGKQHRSNTVSGYPTNFLWFRNGADKNTSVRKYIQMGEAQNLHLRYKCRVRSPWYTVPSVYSTEVGMLKRSHDVPRLILNNLRAYTTDTAYRIRSLGVHPQALVTSFLNPLTALSAELEGRYYGGGVLELVPSEIERLAVPIPLKRVVDIRELDSAVRSLPAVAVLEKFGGRVLAALGVSVAERNELLEAWEHLRNRRQRTTNEERAASD